MTLTKSVLLTAAYATLFAWSCGASSKDWLDVTDPAELKALFTDTTFQGKSSTGEPFTAHNRSDGLRQIVIPQMDLIQKWRVSGSEVCAQIRDGTLPEVCETYQKHAARKGEYQSRRIKDGAVSTLTVKRGTKGARQF